MYACDIWILHKKNKWYLMSDTVELLTQYFQHHFYHPDNKNNATNF